MNRPPTSSAGPDELEMISLDQALSGERSLGGWQGLWRRVTSNPLRALSIPLFLLLWETGSHVVSLRYPESAAVVVMPSLEYIVRTEYPRIANFYGVGFVGQVGHEDSYLIATVVLAQNSLFTLLRLLGGSLIGVLVGVAVGLGMGFDRYFRDVVEPPINLFRAIPALAWTPLFLAVVWWETDRSTVVHLAHHVLNYGDQYCQCGEQSVSRVPQVCGHAGSVKMANL